METFSTGEVEALTGLTTAMLSYWELNVPLLNPRKTKSGLKKYTARDVDMLLRLKYLVNVKKYTIQGAGMKLIEDLSSYDKNAQLLDSIRELRADVSQMFKLIHKYHTKTPTGKSDE